VRFHTAVAAHLGLGATEIKALDLLQRQESLTPKELGEALGLAPASITGLLSRLEARDLVVRFPHPSDGRRVLIRLHESATGRITPLFTSLETELLDMLADRDDDELRYIADLLAELTERLHNAVDGPTPRGY
jgi:DNA-binding MarR family transcriptional regulator